jgi:hypothetical protein
MSGYDAVPDETQCFVLEVKWKRWRTTDPSRWSRWFVCIGLVWSLSVSLTSKEAGSTPFGSKPREEKPGMDWWMESNNHVDFHDPVEARHEHSDLSRTHKLANCQRTYRSHQSSQQIWSQMAENPTRLTQRCFWPEFHWKDMRYHETVDLWDWNWSKWKYVPQNQWCTQLPDGRGAASLRRSDEQQTRSATRHERRRNCNTEMTNFSLFGSCDAITSPFYTHFDCEKHWSVYESLVNLRESDEDAARQTDRTSSTLDSNS